MGASLTSSGAGGGFGVSMTSMTSMSKTRSPAGAPPRGVSPYAIADGIQTRRFSPATMSCTASVQPLITSETPKVIGSPRATELSNMIPSLSQPV